MGGGDLRRKRGEVFISKPSLPRALRQTPTPFEIRFWRLTHPIRQAGWHFRKQAPIGHYIVDFVCHSAKLVIEIDGDSHFTEPGTGKDANRTGFLVEQGYRVLRFTNLEIVENEEAVYTAVWQALGTGGPTPSRPPPSRGR